MKYIRTKDGIRDITGFIDKGSYWQNPNCGLDYIGKEHIINQANAIEELCNNGIIIDLNGKHTITYYLKEKKCWLMGDRKYISAFYGAIWTDKGLIYVAKMNEKGELELL